MSKLWLKHKVKNIAVIGQHFFNERPRLQMSLGKQFLYSPFLVQMVVTRRCNLSCGYCNEYDKTSEPIPLAALKERLDKIHDLGTLAIEFTGGEPLLNPNLVEAISYATKLGFPARMLISNAYLFTEDIVKQLNRAGLTNLQISIDGVKPNKTTVKVLNPLRDKLKIIAEHAEFSVQLSGVIGSCPQEEVIEMIDFAEEHGFVPRVLIIHDHKGQMNLDTSQMKTYEQAKYRIGNRFKESHGYRELLLNGKEVPFKCRAGSRYLYLDEHGLVHWCSQQSQEFEKPLADYTQEDLKEQFYTPKNCNLYCTVGCSRTSSAYDEWREQ